MADFRDDRVATWVETWKKAGPALEAIRIGQLRNFRYEEHAEEIDQLLELACQFAQPRSTSGLVEQQRLFGKLRRPLTQEPG